MSADTARTLVAQRRAFVRDHHPDRGGDVGAFVAGLQDLDRRLLALRHPVVVTARRRPTATRRLHRRVTRLLGRGPAPRVR